MLSSWLYQLSLPNNPFYHRPPHMTSRCPTRPMFDCMQVRSTPELALLPNSIRKSQQQTCNMHFEGLRHVRPGFSPGHTSNPWVSSTLFFLRFASPVHRQLMYVAACHGSHRGQSRQWKSNSAPKLFNCFWIRARHACFQGSRAAFLSAATRAWDCLSHFASLHAAE